MNERSLFLAVLDIADPTERAAYLDRACAGDTALRAQVEQLLKAHEQPSPFMERPAAGLVTTVADPVTERPGTVIGPYKLMEQIGEGGMGLVYVAEQQHPVRRKVALKLIKPGMDTRAVVARFEAERQALALMDHPHIAKVLDGGTTEGGRPYFVMELVKGVPITQFCDDNRLSTRERLTLFADVCAAVQHAHQKGIIHRDLKPSNVLVMPHDGTPVARVIDFGVAKAVGQQLTDKTVYTQFAQLIGTPLYMSPEQAGESGLDVDTRSDVYSLGVVLYELLTGTTPFDRERFSKAGYDEMRRIIREEEPPRPSTRISTLGQAATTVSTQRQSDPRRLSQLFRGELDWIVMKALEKDRNRRYETASAFAADVQRYLHDEPVQACPPSAWYRLRKFARRNRAAVLTIGALAVAAVLVLGSGGWALRARAARRAVTADQVNLALEEARLLQGQRKWPEALAAVKRAEAVLANGSADAELHERAHALATDLGMATRLDGLRSEKTYFDGTGFYVARARADRSYAEAFADYGIDVLADPAEQVATSIQARTVREQLIAALDDWILVEADARARQRLLAVARRADPDEVRNRVRQAVVATDRRALQDLAGRPEVAGFPPATAYLLGEALARAGAGPAAVRVLAAVQQRHPQDFWLNYQLGVQFLWGPGVAHRPDVAAGYLRAALVARPDYPTVYTYLGLALPGPEHLDEVIALNRKAIGLDPTYVSAHGNLGIALRLKGRLREAVAESREAVRLQRDDPGLHVNLAKALVANGELAEAIAVYRETLRLKKDWPELRCDLGSALGMAGRFDEAIAEIRAGIRLKADLPEAYMNLGRCLRAKGRLDEAIDAYRTAVRLRNDDPRAHSDLAYALLARGNYAEAEAEFGAALRVRPDDPSAQYARGWILQKVGRLAEAEAAYRQAVLLAPDHREAHGMLGITLFDQGKYAEAEAQFREVLRARPGDAVNHFNLGNALARQGKPAAALAAYRQALRLEPKLAAAHYELGRTLAGMGKPAEAEAAYREAVRLAPDHAEAHGMLGIALFEQGKYAEAEARFREVLRLRRDDAIAHYNLGNALVRQEKPVAAMAAYREAIRLRRDWAEPHNNLGHTLYDLGKLVEAEAEYRKALRLRPDYPEARANLDHLLKRQGKRTQP